VRRTPKASSTAVDNQNVTGPSFRFRLERVRALRERHERLAQEALAESISRRSASEAGLRDAQQGLEQAMAGQRQLSGESSTADSQELLAHHAFVERMEAQRSRRQDELQRTEADVADRNAELVHASTEHEMLLRLRDRRRREHDSEQARIEVLANDEIAANRYRRSPA
jgi:flagellar export protein FliJ